MNKIPFCLLIYAFGISWHFSQFPLPNYPNYPATSVSMFTNPSSDKVFGCLPFDNAAANSCASMLAPGATCATGNPVASIAMADAACFVEIYDMKEKKAASNIFFNKRQFELLLSGRPSGSYFALAFNERSSGTKRILKL